MGPDFRERDISIPKAEGYWINNQGMVITLSGNIKHIDIVIGFPSLFGYTMDLIMSAYSKAGEPLGHEGRAREKIIKDCIKRGWIRVRRYPKACSWTVNLPELSAPNSSIVSLWARAMVFYGFRYDSVQIDLPVGRILHEMGELVKSNLLM